VSLDKGFGLFFLTIKMEGKTKPTGGEPSKWAKKIKCAGPNKVFPNHPNPIYERRQKGKMLEINGRENIWSDKGTGVTANKGKSLTVIYGINPLST